MKRVLNSFLRYVPKRVKNAGSFLKKAAIGFMRSLYRSRKTLLLVVAAILVTFVFSFLIASWFNNSALAPNGDQNRTIPATGTINVRGLEIYGGDIKSESGKVYVDWGELTLGASKNASFCVKSNSNVDVKLGLNVTNWMPPGIDKYLTVRWDYNGTLLTPTQVILVTVNLEVASDGDFIDFLVENSVTSFGFDMTVYALEV
jgi:hypothetical protein